MMIERLNDYHRRRRCWPSNILFYRDGVSESQYGMVKDEELPQIVTACQECMPPGQIRPKITLLVVAKRHQTRFYHKGESARWNLPAGLCVDSDVIAPNSFNFYLQSHDSPIGTAQNGHYVVIQNDSGYSARDLQGIVSTPYPLNLFIN